MKRRAFLIVLGLCGCAGATQARPASPEHAQTAPTPAPAAPTPVPEPADPAKSSAAASAGQGSALPPQVEAGEISRGTLTAVLAGGVGRFLQRLRAEPRLERGHFIGWHLLSFADGDATLRSGVLQPGDTVMRVNGQSIERPEQFKNVWDSMSTSSDLVLQVQRAGKSSDVRYRIID